jgi:putative ABC transport system permease protein
LGWNPLEGFEGRIVTRKRTNRPPKVAEWILRRIYPDKGEFTSVGDFREEYDEVYQSESFFKANLWYWKQIAKSLPSFIRNKIHWSLIMINNYLKVAFRNIKRHKGYSFINITGLAIGMACTILISFFILDELSYDKYHEKSDSIYRLVQVLNPGTEHEYETVVQSALYAPLLLEEIPEVKNAARIYAPKIWGTSVLIGYKDKKFYTRELIFADASLFEMFSFPFAKGNPETVFPDPQSIVITEKVAEKYFGHENPVGKVITYDNQHQFKVTGVLKNIPRNSHFRFDFVIPMTSYPVVMNERLEKWTNSAFPTYVQLPKNYDITALQEKIPALIKSHRGKSVDTEFWFQPLTRIHLYSHLSDELGTNSDIRYVYIFIVIALFVLSIACMNFINLSTARSVHRAREVGVRKMVGADRIQLIKQFLFESIIICLIALAVSLFLVWVFLPFFSEIFGVQIDFSFVSLYSYIALLVIITLFTGFFSGIFPAFFLSSFNLISVLKGRFLTGKRGKNILRKWLVVAQFTISTLLVICTGIIYNQLNYIQNRDLGFNKESVVVIPTRRDKEVISKAGILKTAFEKDSSVFNVTASSQTPGIKMFSRHAQTEGDAKNKWKSVRSLWVEHGFIKTYELSLLAGRSFSKEFGTDAEKAFVLNEAAVKMFGFSSPENAIGKQINLNYGRKIGTVIGVTKDFNFISLHSKIEPIIMHINPDRFYYISARIKSVNVSATLDYLKRKWREILPQRPFDYFFLDQDYSKQYHSDRSFGTLLSYFSFIAILISCLGLFGLISYSVERRTKEIGIRKVLGASISKVFYLIAKEFVYAIGIASVIAWPVAYFVMSKWLQSFAYRISIGLGAFILSSVLALIVALLTVSYQTIKAATANPVDSLRYE